MKIEKSINMGTVGIAMMIIGGFLLVICIANYIANPTTSNDEARIEIKNGDCDTLANIYIDEDGMYSKHAEQLAKKYFDVRCISNQSLEVIP